MNYPPYKKRQFAAPSSRVFQSVYAQQMRKRRLSQVIEAVTRNFISVSAAAAEYINLAQSITLSGDFEIELDFATNPDGSKTLVGSTPSFIRIGGSAYQYMINANYYSTGVLATTDGSLNTFAMTRTGTVGKLFENGAEIDSRTVVTDDFLIENIFSRGAGGNHFDGIIANVKMWSGGDRNTGTLILDMPLDDSLNPSVAYNRAATTGPELFSTNPADWSTSNANITFADGKVRVTNTAAVRGTATLELGLNSGDELSIYTGAKTGAGEAWVAHPFKGVGVAGLRQAALTNSGAFTIRSNGTDIGDYVEFDFFEIMQITNGLVRGGHGVNLTPDNSGLYTQEDTSWIGPDLITQDMWENPINAQNQWTFANDQWSLDGDGTLNSLQLIFSGDLPGTFRLSGNCAALSGEVATNNPGSTFIDSTGAYTIEQSGADGQVFKRKSGIVTATLDKPSIRHILRTA